MTRKATSCVYHILPRFVTLVVKGEITTSEITSLERIGMAHHSSCWMGRAIWSQWNSRQTTTKSENEVSVKLFACESAVLIIYFFFHFLAKGDREKPNYRLLGVLPACIVTPDSVENLLFVALFLSCMQFMIDWIVLFPFHPISKIKQHFLRSY